MPRPREDALRLPGGARDLEGSSALFGLDARRGAVMVRAIAGRLPVGTSPARFPVDLPGAGQPASVLVRTDPGVLAKNGQPVALT